MIAIENLGFDYPGVRALDDVSAAIPAGSITALVGPNGAGKTTLMRCIATLQIPTSGAIRFGDLDVLAQPDALRRTLGYLPQDFGVYPKISAEEMLDHFAVLKGLVEPKSRRETVKALLAQTNLYAVKDRKLGTFSGGMRQRFGIAQALLGDPRLIIVDEPTAGLDPEERNRFLNLLAEIGENVVVILSTHIVEDVTDLCTRMAILAGGRVQLAGEPRELVAAVEGQVWQKTIAKEELSGYQEQHAVLSSRLVGGRPMLHVWSEGSPGEGFERVPASLADVYFKSLRSLEQRAA